MEEQKVSISWKLLGSTEEEIEKACKERAEEIAKTIAVPNGDETSVVFWTQEDQELICSAIFRKNASGEISYTLDFSQTTL